MLSLTNIFYLFTIIMYPQNDGPVLPSTTFRIKPTKYFSFDIASKKHSKKRTRTITDIRERNAKIKRVATEMTQKQINFQPEYRCITQPKLKAQDLKQQFYLINLCKKLETTAFKLKNPPTTGIVFYDDSSQANQISAKSKQQLKSIKRSRDMHKLVKHQSEIAHNQRETLKNRMKALQMTLPTFRS